VVFDWMRSRSHLGLGILSGLLAGLLVAWLFFGVAGIAVARPARPAAQRLVCGPRYCMPAGGMHPGLGRRLGARRLPTGGSPVQPLTPPSPGIFAPSPGTSAG